MSFFLDFDLTDTHFKCIAGALRASIEVWRSKYELFQIYTPCICDTMEGIGGVLYTIGETKDDVFVLLESKLDKRPTRNPFMQQKPTYRFETKL